MKHYEITIEFTGGLLVGLRYTTVQNWARRVGQRVDRPVGGSPYVVVACTETTVPDRDVA